jgi:uncharacterized membrane protein (DUF373 family)
MKEKILKFTDRFELVIVMLLLVLLMIVVLLGSIGLGAMIVMTAVEKVGSTAFSDMKFTMPLLREVFTGFLMILIGLELMKTIVMYLDKHVVHVEVVLSVAIIAIARHVIDTDLHAIEPLSLIGIGTIIIALAVGYFYFRRGGTPETPQEQ